VDRYVTNNNTLASFSVQFEFLFQTTDFMSGLCIVTEPQNSHEAWRKETDKYIPGESSGGRDVDSDDVDIIASLSSIQSVIWHMHSYNTAIYRTVQYPLHSHVNIP